ncbi:DUF4236 domain-containing protein [Thermoanaerobacter sp. A7A]|uniref:DUF4236 domain-containing protein n=1 Tax=Thermoanaerobacter sp. A7A TaxID=1350366 RepID=UPI000409E6AA|nr:DUF4236 domain-containing protein [Thermoanaerobacter sp. A7A]
MSWRFRRSVSLGKGVRINFSKSGIGFSAGTRGARIGVGPKGAYTSFGIPGTGIYSINYLNKKKKKDSISGNAISRTQTGDVSASYSLMMPPEISQKTSALLGFILIVSLILLFVYMPLGILSFIVFGFYSYTLSKKPVSKATSFFNKGKKAYIRGDYKNALENFLNVVEIVPDAISLYKDIGIIYVHLEEDEKAIESFEKYLSKYVEDLNIKSQYINLLMKVGKYQKALEVINSLPEEYKNSLSVINAMAACYIELNKPDMALAVLEKGPMRKRKTDTEEMKVYRYLLGTVYRKLGQKEKALKQFQKIYVEDSNFLDVAEILNEMEG